MIVGFAVALSALQAQNSITVSDVTVQEGQSAVISVELNNETVFSAFQMDLKLPAGFEVATTVNEDGEEVLDIALNDARKKSTHSLSYNVLDDGTIRIAAFSTQNATFRGTSGEIVCVRVVGTGTSSQRGEGHLSKVLFTTPEAVELDLGTTMFGLNYEVYVPVLPVNEVYANELNIEGVGGSAVLSVELNNETVFSAFQMDLDLPAGFEVATTANEDGEEVLDITLNESRKKSTHSLSYNVLEDGTVRIATFSTQNATFKGTSGEIVRVRVVATEDARESARGSIGRLRKVLFTTPEAEELDLGTVSFRIHYSKTSEADKAVLESAAKLQEDMFVYLDSLTMYHPIACELPLFEHLFSCIEAIDLMSQYSGSALQAEYQRIANVFDILRDALPRMASLRTAYEDLVNEITSTNYPGQDAAMEAVNSVYEFIWSYQGDITGVLQEIQTMSAYLEEIKQEYRDSYVPDVNVSLQGSPYGRCILNGRVVNAGSYYATAMAPGSTLTMYFVPSEGYTLKSMKRNGEEVTVRNNYYSTQLTEDTHLSDLRFEKETDTVVVEKVIEKTDTVVVEKVVEKVDTVVVEKVVEKTDTVVVEKVVEKVIEKIDTVFITKIEELPTPVITHAGGVVTITCEQSDVIILYALNGDPMGGHIYTGPFDVRDNAVVSAIAVRASEVASLYVIGSGVEQSQARAVSCRYYTESGVEVPAPGEGVTIVVAEYPDGSTHTYKMMKR